MASVDAESELLIAQLLEDDLRLLIDAREAEEAQLAQILADSSLASGHTTPITGTQSCRSSTLDALFPDRSTTVTALDPSVRKDIERTELAVLSVLASDARLRSDSLYAQTLQRADNAADTIGRQYAQKLGATEKRIALDAEFAKRLQQMVDNDEDEATSTEDLDVDAEAYVPILSFAVQ